MQIINHKLLDEHGNEMYTHSDNFDSAVNPKYLILHCTDTTSSMQNNVASFLRPEYNDSAHLLIGRNGEIVQFVPFNLRARHAGGGRWYDVPGNMNSWSLGIELLNAADLDENDQGEIHKRGVLIPEEDRVYLQHRLQYSPRWWQIYPQAQVDAALTVTRLLFQTYDTMEDVMMHDEIVPPNIRIDPGPAFPMQWFHAQVLGLDETMPIKRVNVTTCISHLYHGPGVNYQVIDSSRLERNVPLGIMTEQDGWAYIHVLQEVGGLQDLVGWIQSDRITEDSLRPRHYHKPPHIVIPEE
jgi:N-acetylmuramoyl-L-alanine amidase